MTTTTRRITAISSAGVASNQGTQCNHITTAICDDGSVWELRDNDTAWRALPQVPGHVEPFRELAQIVDASRGRLAGSNTEIYRYLVELQLTTEEWTRLNRLVLLALRGQG